MKPTQKKPTKAQALGQSGRPPQSQTAGNTTKKPASKAAEKPTGLMGIIKSIDPVMIAAGGLILVLLLGALFYFVFAGNKTETVQTQQQQTVAEDEFGEPEEPEAMYPPDHFLASQTPLQTLAAQLTEKALAEHPSYSPGMGFSFPDGTVYPEGSPELMALRQDINNRILMDLNSRAQVQADPETSKIIVIARDDATGQMLPLASEMAAANFENQSYRAASLAIDNLIAQKSLEARNAVQEVPVVVEKEVVVESVLSDEEKRKYITLIETQERENKKLRDQMAAVQKDMLQQRNQVIDVIQRIEDSPAASQRLRASMLPKITGLEQHSIVGDRVWFQDKDGNLTTYRIGEVIDGTSLMITGTDEGSGVVLVTPR